MSISSVDEFLQRARSALAMPTLYWLGHGGWQGNEAPSPQPGRRIDIAAELAAKHVNAPAVARQYEAGLLQLGLNIDDLPRVACDCSGFVAWALGLRRGPAPLSNGWINTDSIHHDASGAQSMFRRQSVATAGCLLVHPKSADQPPKVGHVAIVTAVDAQGRATRLIHCAPENFLIEPAAGGARNAIAETGTEHFDAQPRTLNVAYAGFSA